MIDKETDKASSESSYVGLGSNVGDRETNLKEALRLIGARGVIITAISSIWETEPVGLVEQPLFLNQVIRIDLESIRYRFGSDNVDENRCSSSRLIEPATRFLKELLSIEEGMGRVRRLQNEPRIIDLDLLLAGDAIIRRPATTDLPAVTLPHPGMHERRFVLAPLAEIGAAVVHPILKQTIGTLLSGLPPGPAVRLWHPTSDR